MLCSRLQACRDFLDVAESHSRRWQKALQHEREQRHHLEETIEQLAKQHNSLERAWKENPTSYTGEMHPSLSLKCNLTEYEYGPLLASRSDAHLSQKSDLVRLVSEFLVHLSTGKEQKYNRIALLNYRFSDKCIICIVEDVIC